MIDGLKSRHWTGMTNVHAENKFEIQYCGFAHDKYWQFCFCVFITNHISAINNFISYAKISRLAQYLNLIYV